VSYSAVEAALKGQIEAITSPNLAGWVTQGDFRVLNKGATWAVVLVYDSFEHSRLDFGGDHQYLWRVRILLFVRYQDDVQVQTDTETARQAILDRLAEYPKLGGVSGVLDALVVSGTSEPDRFTVGEISFFAESLVCEVTEDVEVAEAE